MDTNQQEFELDLPFPPILTLGEFVEQMERKYGPNARLAAIRAAMEENES